MTVPGPSTLPVPFGHVSVDFGKCVLALSDLPPNTNLFAIGDPISWEEYLRIFCSSQGLTFGGIDEASYEEFCTLLPGGLGHEFAQNVLFAHEFGYEGRGEILRPKDVSYCASCVLMFVKDSTN